MRAQAYTLAMADGFILIGWMVVAYLLLMLFLRPGRISYQGPEEHAMNRGNLFRMPAMVGLAGFAALAPKCR